MFKCLSVCLVSFIGSKADGDIIFVTGEYSHVTCKYISEEEAREVVGVHGD